MTIAQFLEFASACDECLILEVALTFESGFKLQADTPVFLRPKLPTFMKDQQACKLMYGGSGILIIQTHSKTEWVGQLLTEKSFR